MCCEFNDKNITLHELTSSSKSIWRDILSQPKYCFELIIKEMKCVCFEVNELDYQNKCIPVPEMKKAVAKVTKS